MAIRAFEFITLGSAARRHRAARIARRLLGATIGSFAGNASGGVATTFAITMIPAMALIGAAADYGQANDDKTRLQAAVDAAVLAGEAAPATNQVAVATAVFANNISSAKDFTLTTASLTGNTTATFTANSDGTFSGSATATITTGVMGAAMAMTVGSKANPSLAQTASNVTFTLTGGYGWYWKQVNLYKHEPGAASDTLVASYTYQPVDLSYQGGRGDGTVTAQFLSNGAMVAGFVNTAVALGSTYDNAYMTMTVYSDGCGPGMAPQTAQSTNTTNVVCVASGTQATTQNRWGEQQTVTYTKTATPVVYSSNDPATSNHLFIQANGVNTDMPLGQKVSVFTLLPCGQTVQHSWEDTPWSASQGMGGSWAQQDIFFNVQATACAANASYQSGQPYLSN